MKEIAIQQYLKEFPPVVEVPKAEKVIPPINYYKAVAQPINYRRWSRTEQATLAGWETKVFTLDEDIILTGIYINTFGLTQFRLQVGSTDNTFNGVSGSGLGLQFIPIPNWLLTAGTVLVTWVYLGAPANDAINVTYVGIPKNS